MKRGARSPAAASDLEMPRPRQHHPKSRLISPCGSTPSPALRDCNRDLNGDLPLGSPFRGPLSHPCLTPPLLAAVLGREGPRLLCCGMFSNTAPSQRHGAGPERCCLPQLTRKPAPAMQHTHPHTHTPTHPHPIFSLFSF